MILIQHILLIYHKDCRGGKGAVERNKFPQALALPRDFFDVISEDVPFHNIIISQRPDGFHIEKNSRETAKLKQNKSLRLSPAEIIPKEKSCEVRYRSDWHAYANPKRCKYSKDGTRVLLNERAFELRAGEYGRLLCNGRFTDYDTGVWWYENTILNVINTGEEKRNIPKDIFLLSESDFVYKQMAKLF